MIGCEQVLIGGHAAHGVVYVFGFGLFGFVLTLLVCSMLSNARRMLGRGGKAATMNQARTCQRAGCGEQNPPQAAFCGRCGERLVIKQTWSHG